MPRIIPILTLHKNRIVKRRSFNENQEIYIGDPVNSIKIFSDHCADEIILLGLDKKRLTPEDYVLLKGIAHQSLIPLAYGGGIDNVLSAEKIINIGFEKVSLNSALYEDPNLIKECVMSLGSQAVIASIDYRYINNKPMCFNPRTRKILNIDAKELAFYYQKLGCGEILMTNIDRENQWFGLDLKMASTLPKLLSVPVIIHGGVGKIEDISSLFETTHCDVGVGGFFMFTKKAGGIALNYPFLPRYRGNIEPWRM